MAGFTPEEAAAIRQQEIEEIQQFGKASDATRKQLLDLSVGIKGTTDAMTAHMKSFGTSGIDLIKDLNAGKVGATVFNNTVGSMASALGDLLGMIPYVGGALKALVKGAGDYTKAVNVQAEALMNSYKQMGAMGAATAGGIEDVYANLKNLNLGATEADLQKFGSMVKENAQTLASFGTTVGSGVKEFANITRVIHDNVGPEFREMGISIDEMNAGVASFIKMQTLTGGRQKMTTDQLVAASQDYIKEVDLLAKMTGKNRAEQEAAKESAMAEERYAAFKYELEQRANMGDKAAGEQLKQVERTQIALATQAPGLRTGFLNILSGTINNPESQKLLRSYPEAAAVAMQKGFTGDKFFGAIKTGADKALAVNADGSSGSAVQMGKLGVNNANFSSIQESMKLQAFTSKSLAEREAESVKNQTLTNQATKDGIALETENLKSRDKLNDLLNVGIPLVTKSMKGLAGATESTIDGMTSMAKKLGVTVSKRDAAPPPAPSGGGGGAGGANTASAAAPAGGGGGGGGAAGGGGVRTASSSGGVGTFGEPVKPRSQPPEGSGSGSASEKVDLTKILAFTSKSGSRQNFEGLNDTFKNSVISAATEYNKLTGGVLTINSAKRDSADQQRLWDESVAAGRTGVTASGMPIGKPGRSLHERGEAVDIQNYQDPKAVAALNKYGLLQKVPKDPVHFQAANGGIVPPLPGGTNVLAGEAGLSEAVVPLPDGKTIPVQMGGSEGQISMMTAQLDRLDQMVRIMQSQLGVSEKILKYAQ